MRVVREPWHAPCVSEGQSHLLWWYAICLPIGKQTNHLVRFQVHEYTAETLTAKPSPIVNPNNMHLTNLREGYQKEGPKHAAI